LSSPKVQADTRPPLNDVSTRLLVVEDDQKFLRALERGLAREGYLVDIAATGREGLAQAIDREYGAVILDLMLPDRDGFSVCAELRRRQRWVPVLMLTARSDVSDRIRGLDGGADDYLVKPFDFGELLARLRALIRRGPSQHPLALTVGDLRIDPTTRAVFRAGRKIELTAREFAVLELLAQHAGEVVSRAQLLEHVWDTDDQVSLNLVDVYVGYLRRKLERPFGRALIHTVRGTGFRLEPE
jgi:two-component system, OmpR family, response regulator